LPIASWWRGQPGGQAGGWPGPQTAWPKGAAGGRRHAAPAGLRRRQGRSRQGPPEPTGRGRRSAHESFLEGAGRGGGGAGRAGRCRRHGRLGSGRPSRQPADRALPERQGGRYRPRQRRRQGVASAWRRGRKGKRFPRPGRGRGRPAEGSAQRLPAEASSSVFCRLLPPQRLGSVVGVQGGLHGEGAPVGRCRLR